MVEIICAILFYILKVLFFVLMAFSGMYTGYRLRCGLEIYFKKQRKNIDKYGKLIAYMYRHYNAVYRKNKKLKNEIYRSEKWLYMQCYNFAKDFEIHEINCAKAHLKSDIKTFEVMSLIITTAIAMGTVVVHVYTEVITSILFGNDETKYLYFQNMLLIVYFMFLICFIWYMLKLIRRQQFLLSILNDIKT